MANNIKGITVEFSADTKKLDKALNGIKRETKSIDTQLRDVNNALKFNPGNTQLLAQKTQLLDQRVQSTAKSLETLKQKQAALDDDPAVDKTSADYMALQREIITTESKLKHFNGELIKTRAEASKLGKASKTFDAWSKKLDTASQKMRGLSTAAAGVSAALLGSAYKAGTYADDLNTLSKVTGIGTQDLQKYGAAADLVDVSVESIAKTQQKLKKNMLGALDGTNDQAQYFKELGVEITNADGSMRDAGDVWDDTIKALGKMENETQRDAYAMALMGKSATDLNPLIADGGVTYEKVAKLLDSTNLSFIDQETLDQANEFNDQIDTIKLVVLQLVRTVGSKIAGALVPAITTIQEKVASLAKVLSGLSGKQLAGITGVAAAIAGIAPALLVASKAAAGLSTITGGLSKIIAKGGKLGKVLGFLSANPFILIAAAVVALLAVLSKLGVTGKDVEKFFKNLTDKVTKLVPVITDKLVKGLQSILSMLPTLLPAFVNGAVTLFSGFISAIPVILPSLLTAVKSLISAVIKTLPTLAVSLLNAAITLFKAFVKAIPEVIKALKAALPGIGKAVKDYITTTFKTTITNALKNVPGWFGSAFSKAWSAIKGKFAGWSEFWSGLWDKVKNKFGNIGKALGGAISTSLKSGVNAMIGKIENIINKAIDRINSAIDWVNKYKPGKDFKHVGHVDLPELASGGIVNAATVALIGEGRSPEAVVPLDKLWAQMEKMNAQQAAGSNVVINVTAAPGMDVNELAAAVERRLIDAQKRRRLAWA